MAVLIFHTRNEKAQRLFTGPREFHFVEPKIDAWGSLTWSLRGDHLRGVTEIVPAFSDPGSLGIVSRFTAIARDRLNRSYAAPLDWIGGEAGALNKEPSSGPLTIDVDTIKVGGELDTLDIRLEFKDQRTPSREALITVSLRGGAAGGNGRLSLSEGELAVPPISQFESDAAIGHRICSPTSVSMVLGYYGIPASPSDVAALAYHPHHDLYGVWPANVRAAAERGLVGGLCHIDSWETVDHFLRRGVPVIASIRYTPEELSGAPFYRGPGETVGHLVVVRGCLDGKIIVNDPAGKTSADVRRAYDPAEFSKVWFERSGMAYILIR